MNDGVWFKSMFPYQTEVTRHIKYFHEEKKKTSKENVKRCTLKAPFLSSSFLLIFLYASVISFCDITCHNSSSKHVELGAVAVKVVVFSV